MTRIGNPYAVADYSHTDEEPILWFAWFQCDACRYASMASIRVSPYAVHVSYRNSSDVALEFRHGNSKTAVKLAVAHKFDDEGTRCEWYPVMSLGREFEDVPQHIADAASEAYACFSIRSYRAAILMARSVLEACAKDKGATKGNLASKIDALADNGIISSQIREEAHEIRYLGNDMAHGDFVEPVDENDADDMLGFLATFLNYVYQMPAAIRRRQEARRSRNANPSA